MDFKWYEVVNGENITQGDIILDCPVFKPYEIYKASDGKNAVNGDIEIIDAIVMTQACDIANGAVEDIILCSLLDVVEGDIGRDNLSEIKKGAQPKYHIISNANIDGCKMGYKVVDFMNIYSLSIEALKKVAAYNKNRLRLLPPYREHLSQAFARYFMRVGLPSDIDIKDILKEKREAKGGL